MSPCTIPETVRSRGEPCPQAPQLLDRVERSLRLCPQEYGRPKLCCRLGTPSAEMVRHREAPKSRQETREFGADLPRKLKAIQKRLREKPYKFSRQFGATPEKDKGKGKRPLVIAPIEDRIVQRAILDVLQDADDLTQVQAILATPTSIGGIRGRGVEHAINLIEDAYVSGDANFVAGSDISGFFTKIPQSEVVAFIGSQTDDCEFIDLFTRALTGC